MTQIARSGTGSQRWQGLADLLHVEPGEARPLALLWAHSFFAGVAVVPLFAAGNALFLVQFSTDLLPHAYIASAGMSIAAAGDMAGRLATQCCRWSSFCLPLPGLP